MSTPVRVAGFVAGLVAVFALALGAGAAFGPDGPAVAAPAHGSHGSDDSHDSHGSHAAASSGAEVPGGLMVAQDGYTLSLARATSRAGRDVPLRFTVTGPDGAPVTSYDVQHEKRLHLVAVRRDLTGFQHVHPTLGSDGTWSTTLDLTPGPWRVFADFAPTGGDPLVLGTDLLVPGAFAPAVDDRERRVASVDGYSVTLDGSLAGGRDARLSFAVTLDGRPVTDLQPYLGAAGHLVALRSGDLAYLHVHPDDGLVFHAEVPSEGTYHLFLDFKHRGVVRTAAFTLRTAS